MVELTGKYNSAKVFTDIIDEASVSQIMELLNQPFVEGQRIRFMPDVHAGAGCVIGTTMTIGDKVCPNLVGVDIGCGVDTYCLGKLQEVDYSALDKAIRKYVPSGHSVHDQCSQVSLTQRNAFAELKNLRCVDHINMSRAFFSIGTLGGGNHFIEMDKDEDGNYYLVIHSGSRHLGVEVATYYQDLAYRTLTNVAASRKEEIVEKLKAENRQSEIAAALKAEKAKCYTGSKALAYLEGQNLEDYLHDMKLVQAYAVSNRMAIAEAIIKAMDWKIVDQFETIHNYIDVDARILRKGSVSAVEGKRLLIPINMRDGALICQGKGTEDWNYSAPHGAGRVLARGEAKRVLSMEEFWKSMEGIYTTSICHGTLDESPMVYKSMEDIVNNIQESVEVLSVIKPVYNFKASE